NSLCTWTHPPPTADALFAWFSMRQRPGPLGMKGDARSLVPETGTWRGLDQPGDLIWRKDPRQLPRIVCAGQLMGEVGAVERDSEKRKRNAWAFIFGGCAPRSTCANWKQRMSSPVAV